MILIVVSKAKLSQHCALSFVGAKMVECCWSKDDAQQGRDGRHGTSLAWQRRVQTGAELGCP